MIDGSGSGRIYLETLLQTCGPIAVPFPFPAFAQTRPSVLRILVVCMSIVQVYISNILHFHFTSILLLVSPLPERKILLWRAIHLRLMCKYEKHAISCTKRKEKDSPNIQ